MLLYMFSFAGYNWREGGSKLAAVGSAFLALAACGLGLFVLFSGLYEL